MGDHNDAELVQRLRKRGPDGTGLDRDCQDAADRLVARSADVAELREQADRAVIQAARAIAQRDAAIEALRGLVEQVQDYERVNNLAPNPGRTHSWDATERAVAALASLTDKDKAED